MLMLLLATKMSVGSHNRRDAEKSDSLSVPMHAPCVVGMCGAELRKKDYDVDRQTDRPVE